MLTPLPSTPAIRLAPGGQKSLAPGERKARVLAVAAQKGGVGKTTTTVTLAAAWARFHGLRVLVVDLDPQAHVSVALRSQIEAGGGALTDVLIDPARYEIEEITTATRVPGLFVTPPDPGLVRAEDRLSTRIGRELLLRRSMEVTRTHYDLILLDCPPNVGALAINALCAADAVVIPCAASALAVAGVSGLLTAVEEVRAELHPELAVLGMVLTMVDGRNARTNDTVSELVRATFGELLLPVQIGVSNALTRAQLDGCDVFSVAPESRGAAQYRTLASVLLGRLRALPSHAG